eukprot:5346950-Pleurochrysis_carterae.AAC.1
MLSQKVAIKLSQQVAIKRKTLEVFTNTIAAGSSLARRRNRNQRGRSEPPGSPGLARPKRV